MTEMEFYVLTEKGSWIVGSPNGFSSKPDIFLIVYLTKRSLSNNSKLYNELVMRK